MGGSKYTWAGGGVSFMPGFKVGKQGSNPQLVTALYATVPQSMTLYIIHDPIFANLLTAYWNPIIHQICIKTIS